MLKRRCESLRPNDFIFTDPDGGQIDIAHASRVFEATQKKIGIKKILRFHDLRHTFASNFMMNGGDIFTLQKLLGHSDIKTTMIYAHLSRNHLQKMANVVHFGGGK